MATGEHARLVREFEAAGIDVTTPGFCDSQAFIIAEARDPTLLLKYGRYVRCRPRDEAYEARVRERVPQIANFFAAELARDGRLGAYADVSSVALKFLEREGIWGYVAVGSFVVSFLNPGGRRITLHHFMHPRNQASAGHAWLCVPPFDIVDLTPQAQAGFTAVERGQLAPVVVEGPTIETAVTLEELVEPDLRDQFYVDVGRPGQIGDFVGRSLREYWGVAPARVVELPALRLKYVECGVAAMDGSPLEELRNLTLSGQTPIDLRAQFVGRYPAPGQ
ncbi:MAG: hypothetical protein AB7I25_02020 [Vicinamibacterales bacterium]